MSDDGWGQFTASNKNKELRSEISDLKKTLLRLIACLAVELGAETAKSLIKEINIHDDDG